tara:strand:- start:208 stop:384 length:177 start_codon:yes stop_codon:yes gene_type:complete
LIQEYFFAFKNNNECISSKKHEFLKEACFFFKNESDYAEEGHLQSCAGLISRALDKER